MTHNILDFCVIFTFPSAAPKFSFFSPSLQRLVFFQSFYYVRHNACMKNSSIVLICLSLIADDVNIFLMNLPYRQAYIFITERSVQVISISILLLKVIVMYFETFQVILANHSWCFFFIYLMFTQCFSRHFLEHQGVLQSLRIVSVMEHSFRFQLGWLSAWSSACSESLRMPPV